MRRYRTKSDAGRAMRRTPRVDGSVAHRLMYLAYGQSASPMPNPPTLETDALSFRWSVACPINLFLKIREMARIAGLLLALARMGCLRAFEVLFKREARSCGRSPPFFLAGWF